MPSQPHASVQAVHDAASDVLASEHRTPSGSFWRRWLEAPHERHFVDHIRAFIVTLDRLLDIPPTLLTPGDLAAIGEDVARVAARAEVAIDESGAAGADAAAALAPAIYLIRTRYEEIYRRGATKGA